MSPTQLSLRKLRKDGWLCAIVEKWNQYVKIRQDLWGFGDLLCIKDDRVLIVQTTTAANLSARVKKIVTHPNAHRWLQSSYRSIECHGWSKKGGTGKRKTWQITVIPVGPHNLEFPALPNKLVEP